MLTATDDFEDLGSNYKELPSEEMPQTWFTTGLTWLFKDPVVYTAKTVAGCAAAVVIAPKAAPVVVGYLLPTSVPGSVGASTTVAAVGVMTYAVGSKVTEKVVSTAWDGACLAVDTAICYAFTNAKKNLPQNGLELQAPSKTPFASMPQM